MPATYIELKHGFALMFMAIQAALNCIIDGAYPWWNGEVHHKMCNFCFGFWGEASDIGSSRTGSAGYSFFPAFNLLGGAIGRRADSPPATDLSQIVQVIPVGQLVKAIAQGVRHQSRQSLEPSGHLFRG